MIELLLLGGAGILLLNTSKKKGIGALPYERNRRLAAEALFDIASSYEDVAYSTVYKNCFYSPQYGCWRYIGKAHDYSY